MNNPALEALFYPFSGGFLPPPNEAARALFLNGQAGADLDIFSTLTVQQYQKHITNDLQAQGANVTADLPEPGVMFDIVLILAPKQRVEWHYLLVSGLQHLKPGGLILCAAANDAGGKRLEKDMEEFGLACDSESKSKARVVWAIRPATLPAIIADALAAGAAQPVEDSGFMSQPGIFGWDKIDRGSALLALTLPVNSLKGTGADFGCGYGFLSHFVLKSQPAITTLHVIDTDARALSCCAVNLQEAGAGIQSHWLDLTSDALPFSGRLNFIVMNPPFHEGKNTLPTLGKRFIERAADSLAPQGVLWMVANTHLPYEAILKDTFRRVELIINKDGFKIFKAQK